MAFLEPEPFIGTDLKQESFAPNWKHRTASMARRSSLEKPESQRRFRRFSRTVMRNQRRSRRRDLAPQDGTVSSILLASAPRGHWLHIPLFRGLNWRQSRIRATRCTIPVGSSELRSITLPHGSDGMWDYAA